MFFATSMQRVSRRQEYRTLQHCVEYASVGSYTSGIMGHLVFQAQPFAILSG